MRFTQKVAFAVMLAPIAVSCTKDKIEQPAPSYNIPTTYSFKRNDTSTVDYNGQTTRIKMLEELVAYVNTAKSLGTTISAQKILDMYRNVNSPFSTALDPTKNLSSKTFSGDTALFISWMNEAASASTNTSNAAPGTAGVINAEYPSPGTAASAGYLVNANGFDYKEFFEKGFMGAVLYYQAMETYLTVDRMNDAGLGNDKLVSGKNYTEMEHYFDEAFGYFGIPDTISNNTTNTAAGKFFGKYMISRANDMDDYGMPGINEKMLNAFIRARAAITNKDYAARNIAISDIAKYWEIITAMQACHYLSSCLSSQNQPMYKKLHMLSEGVGMMKALGYHFESGNCKVPRYSSQAKINEALSIIGLSTNLYSVTDADINNCISKIKAAFPTGVIQ